MNLNEISTYLTKAGWSREFKNGLREREYSWWLRSERRESWDGGWAVSSKEREREREVLEIWVQMV